MNGPEGRVVTVPVCAGSVEKKVTVILTTISWDFTDPSGSVVTIVVTVPVSCSKTGKLQIAVVPNSWNVSSIVFITKVGWPGLAANALTCAGSTAARASESNSKPCIPNSNFLLFIFSPLILNWFEKNIIQGSLHKTGMDINSIKLRGHRDGKALVNKNRIKF